MLAERTAELNLRTPGARARCQRGADVAGVARTGRAGTGRASGRVTVVTVRPRAHPRRRPRRCRTRHSPRPDIAGSEPAAQQPPKFTVSKWRPIMVDQSGWAGLRQACGGRRSSAGLRGCGGRCGRCVCLAGLVEGLASFLHLAGVADGVVGVGVRWRVEEVGGVLEGAARTRNHTRHGYGYYDARRKCVNHFLRVTGGSC